MSGRFIIPRNGMISAQGDALSRKLKVATDSRGRRWLYNDDLPDAGGYIYVEGGPNSDGFGGATIHFQLVDGGELALKGPWHSNSDSLRSATGIDLTQRHITFGVIGEDRGWMPNSNDAYISGVLHSDPAPTEGDFSRIEHLANEMAHKLGKELAYYSESRSGSSFGFTHVLKERKQ